MIAALVTYGRNGDDQSSGIAGVRAAEPNAWEYALANAVEGVGKWQLVLPDKANGGEMERPTMGCVAGPERFVFDSCVLSAMGAQRWELVNLTDDGGRLQRLIFNRSQ